jgi:hypothetical protein
VTLAAVDMGAALRAANAWALLAVLVAIVALSGWGIWAWLRQRRANRRDPMPLQCPVCHRSYPAGTVYCTLDAERLVPVGRAAQPARGGRCPRCQRSFAAGMRFCPVDAEELQPTPDHRGDLDGLQVEPGHDHLVGGEGKICPVCASRYALEAQVCGRDGSELVTVN